MHLNLQVHLPILTGRTCEWEGGEKERERYARGRDFHLSPDFVCHFTTTLVCPPFSKPLISENSEKLFLLAGCNLLLTYCWFLFAFLWLPQQFAQMRLLEFLPLEKMRFNIQMTDEVPFSEDPVTPGRTQPWGIVSWETAELQLSCWTFNSINCRTEIKVLPDTFMQTLHNHSPNLTITAWCCVTLCKVEGTAGEWHYWQWVLHNKVV